MQIIKDRLARMQTTIFVYVCRPWDSSTLDNLLNIAQLCEQPPPHTKAPTAFGGNEPTIVESAIEDACSLCASTSGASTISAASSGSPNSVELRQEPMSGEEDDGAGAGVGEIDDDDVATSKMAATTANRAAAAANANDASNRPQCSTQIAHSLLGDNPTWLEISRPNTVGRRHRRFASKRLESRRRRKRPKRVADEHSTCSRESNRRHSMSRRKRRAARYTR